MRPLTRVELEALYALGLESARRWPWRPIPDDEDGPHPQRLAYESTAQIIGYGGAAGGGKTDLACGLALTQHRTILMLRRVGTEMQGIEDRLEGLIGNKDGFNGQKKIWKRKRADGVAQQIEFASLPNAGDERGFQGRPHDLVVYDEAANFLESQVRFLLGWLRTTVKGQRCRALLTFNPPTSEDGRWVIAFFAPWLDPMFPDPAEPGELRWCATIAGKDHWVPDNRPFVLHKQLALNDPAGDVHREPEERVYDFNPKLYVGKNRTRIITPMSRTFIPSRVTDNPFLMDTGYMTTLQALPEPLRSQMLDGDFMAGVMEDPWQVIPTAWVEAAQARWKPLDVKPPMDSMGVDVARGGADKTVISARHGWWFDKLKYYPGIQTPNGHATAALVVVDHRDDAPIHIDVIGVGASPYDILNERYQTIGVNVAEKAVGTDKSGRLRFMNLRSELWWRMRELLDPEANTGVALPPDPELKADLCAPRWSLSGMTVKVESREDIIKRIERSPDAASAVILAAIETPKLSLIRGVQARQASMDYDPYGRP